MGPIRVHKLRQVRADQLVLPERTVALLDRNVIGFVARRQKLKSLGLPAKKGLLFYGPPGTGKTYTVHYLATQLPSHTTLLITAEQVGLLDNYFQLARFLQPALIVIEDVDLIARNRENMNSPCEEALLNKLLNEMDGLREDAEILFELTTNRPDQLETALASRPGRIDQAIEFPLPDEEGRRRLTSLYACGLELRPEILELVVRKTAGGSAALIKELMRRAAQFLLESGDSSLQPHHIDSALEEMLFSGGSLNSSLLGGVGVQRVSCTGRLAMSSGGSSHAL
jgi:ATP-dependent 26S proteasome regulatory subunit